MRVPAPGRSWWECQSSKLEGGGLIPHWAIVYNFVRIFLIIVNKNISLMRVPAPGRSWWECQSSKLEGGGLIPHWAIVYNSVRIFLIIVNENISLMRIFRLHCSTG